MQGSTVSAKYQIVIPKELRAVLSVKPGQKVYFKRTKDNQIVIDVNSPIEDFYGIFAADEVWGTDPVSTVRESRDE